MSNKEQIRNAEFLMVKRGFELRFEALFTDLQKFSINGYFKSTIQQFRSCLQPDEAQSETRFPHLSYKPVCREANKDRCVLCVLSFALLNYHNFLRDNNLRSQGEVNEPLTHLEDCAEYGRQAYSIAGKFPKFYLERVE